MKSIAVSTNTVNLDATVRMINNMEAEIARLITAESALQRITDLLHIDAEPDSQGRYCGQTLVDQVRDALNQWQFDQAQSSTPMILTASGTSFSLTSPSPDDIDEQDIAVALSRICRFGGHSRQFYSVPQHCCLASEIVPPEDALAALLHDAAEAYIGDMVSPLKALLPAYRAIEQRVWVAIAQRFNVDPVLPDSVKKADMRLLATERRDLMPNSTQAWPYLEGIEPLSEPIEPWSPEIAASGWGFRLEELLGEREVAV